MFVNLSVAGQHWRVHWGTVYWKFRRDFNQVNCISTILFACGFCVLPGHIYEFSISFLLCFEIDWCQDWKLGFVSLAFNILFFSLWSITFCVSQRITWSMVFESCCLLNWTKWSQPRWFTMYCSKPLFALLLPIRHVLVIGYFYHTGKRKMDRVGSSYAMAFFVYQDL